MVLRTPEEINTFIEKYSSKKRKYDSNVRSSEQIQGLPPIEHKIPPPQTDIEIFKTAMLRDAKTLDRHSQDVIDFIKAKSVH